MNQKTSLLIIGNSNVGKSSITRLLMPNPRKFKGKIGKTPGSTLLIKSINQKNLPFNIVDLPGFGYVSQASRRRAEHIKKQIIIHIENHYNDYFLALVVINVLRIEDELKKYFIQNKRTIPLSFELINFLKEFEIPLLIIINKIDKVSDIDKNKKISFLIDTAKDYGLNITDLNNYKPENETDVPLLKFSALKKINVNKLKQHIQTQLNLFNR
ncbi:MAG: GTPase [Candidatus Odinarchaeota archaeon]